MTQGSSDLCPDSIDIIVQGLEGKDLELGLLVGEEAKDSGCCDEAGHGDGRAIGTGSRNARWQRHAVKRVKAVDPRDVIKREVVKWW